MMMMLWGKGGMGGQKRRERGEGKKRRKGVEEKQDSAYIQPLPSLKLALL
jgi:hypothetical protein